MWNDAFLLCSVTLHTLCLVMQNAQPCNPWCVSGLFLAGVFGQTFVYYAEFCLLPVLFGWRLIKNYSPLGGGVSALF